LDVGLLLQSPLQTNSFKVEPLIEEAVLVISPMTHRLADSDLVKPGDLEGETILLTETGCGYRHLFERSLAGGQVYNVIKLEFSSVEAIKQSVMAGLGIGFLPRVAVQEEISSGDLCALKWEKPYIISTQLIYHPDKWKSPAMAAFVELCRAEIGKGTVPRAGLGRETGFV
jgi:DNA-binding transcriptional LysR family regulator